MAWAQAVAQQRSKTPAPRLLGRPKDLRVPISPVAARMKHLPVDPKNEEKCVCHCGLMFVCCHKFYRMVIIENGMWDSLACNQHACVCPPNLTFGYSRNFQTRTSPPIAVNALSGSPSSHIWKVSHRFSPELKASASCVAFAEPLSWIQPRYPGPW